MNLVSFLDERGVPYQKRQHATAYTAQDVAAAEHISGRRVIKPVIVDVDGRVVMCAMPASTRVDLDRLRAELSAEQARLVDEKRMAELFPDCEIGAEPPIGMLFGIPTFIDESLFGEKEVVFQAGTHREAVCMALSDYMRVAQPQVGHFGAGSH